VTPSIATLVTVTLTFGISRFGLAGGGSGRLPGATVGADGGRMRGIGEPWGTGLVASGVCARVGGIDNRRRSDANPRVAAISICPRSQRAVLPEVIAALENCDPKRAPKTSRSVPSLSSPVGSAIAAPLNVG